MPAQLHEYHWFEYISATDCTGSPTVLLESSSVQAATDRGDLGTLTNVGDQLQLPAPTIPGWVFATISDDTGCTDLSVYYLSR